MVFILITFGSLLILYVSINLLVIFFHIFFVYYWLVSFIDTIVFSWERQGHTTEVYSFIKYIWETLHLKLPSLHRPLIYLQWTCLQHFVGIFTPSVNIFTIFTLALTIFWLEGKVFKPNSFYILTYCYNKRIEAFFLLIPPNPWMYPLWLQLFVFLF